MIIPFMYACKKELSASEYLTSHQGELTNLNELFKEGRVYIAEKDLDKAEKFRVDLFNESKKSLKKIKTLEAYEEDGFMKKKTLEVIRFYKYISSSEQRELIQILRKEKLELIDDVRVAQLNRDFDKMVAEQFESWTKAKMQFERMYKVSIPKGNLLER